MLYALERARERLQRFFPRAPDEVTVVLHRGFVGLSLTNPLLPVAWLATAPAARRYVAGWAGAREIHVLAPAQLESRGSNVPGSRQMLELAPVALYARRLITENNHELSAARTLPRMLLELRWSWLLEGGARWFAGQADHSRPAIARRLREGRRPSFPPDARDAPLLGPTVVDLLARERGEAAAARFVRSLHPQGPRGAVAAAFAGRPLSQTERAWRSHLELLASAA